MAVIVTADHGPVRVVSLNRPDVRNALNTELREALFAALASAEAEPGVRALVLTGEDRAFCAGLDLRELAGDAADALGHREQAERLGALFLRLHLFPKPVVAAVQGAAVAGGAGLASACDLVIAAEGARFGYTEVRIGFVAALVAAFLTRQVGDRNARELLLTGRLVDAATARALGLVNEVVSEGEERNRAIEVAHEIAQHAPGALASTKALLAALPGMGLEDGLRHAASVNALARSTAELREGVAAFLEKREPSWRPPELDRDPDTP